MSSTADTMPNRAVTLASNMQSVSDSIGELFEHFDGLAICLQDITDSIDPADPEAPKMQALILKTKQAITKAAETFATTDLPPVPDYGQFLIRITSPHSKNYQIYVASDTTLLELMQMVEGYTGVQVFRQLLFRRCRLIADGDKVRNARYSNSVSTIGIQAGDEILVLPKIL